MDHLHKIRYSKIHIILYVRMQFSLYLLFFETNQLFIYIFKMERLSQSNHLLAILFNSIVQLLFSRINYLYLFELQDLFNSLLHTLLFHRAWLHVWLLLNTFSFLLSESLISSSTWSCFSVAKFCLSAFQDNYFFQKSVNKQKNNWYSKI